MVKTPKTRHSSSPRKPVTIDLEPGAVSRVDTTASGTVDPADEPVGAASQHLSADPAAGEPAAAQPEINFDTPPLDDRKIADDKVADQEKAEDVQPERGSEPSTFEIRSEAGTTAPPPNEPPAEPQAVPAGDAATPPPDAAAAPRRSGLGYVAAGVIGGIVTLAGAAALQYSGVLPSPTAGISVVAPNTDAVESDVAALREEVASLRENAGGGADAQLRQTVDGLGSSVQQISSDVARLKEAVQTGGGGDAAAVSALDNRIKDIEAGLARLGETSTKTANDLSALNGRVGALDAQVKSSSQAASANGERLAALENSVGSLTSKVEAQAEQPRIALAIASSALKSALNRGEPFVAELDTLAAIAPNLPEIATLRQYAEKGVPTREDIIADMPGVADAMIAAANPAPENAGLFDRLLNSAESLVSVRPIGAVPGQGIPETVARMEAAVKDGDLAKALAEYDTLPEPAKAAGADLAQKIRDRLQTEQLVDQAIAGAVKAA